jgi:hypothetical protein
VGLVCARALATHVPEPMRQHTPVGVVEGGGWVFLKTRVSLALGLPCLALCHTLGPLNTCM